MTRAPTRAERQAAMALAAQGAAKAAAPPPVPDEPPREPTATERLEDLRALRHRCDGPIVPPPAALTLQSAEAWLREIAAIGSAGDVEVAWYRIGDKRLKDVLINKYEDIKAEAGRRYGDLHEAARKEFAREQAAARRRAHAAALRADIVRAEREAAEKRQKLAAMQ